MECGVEVSKIKLICVIGPTAVGKSEIAIEICKRVDGEVISADSMQVYTGMDVGTAKLTKREQAGVPHHLQDIRSPAEGCTVAVWKELADEAVARISARNKIPVICGGTGLYIRAIVDDLTFAEQGQLPEVRERWQAYVDAFGADALHKALQQADPIAASRIHKNDVKRTIRALEVAEGAKRKLSEDYDWSRQAGRYDVKMVGLWMERSAMYRRVEKRVDKMLENGLVDEVKELLRSGLHPSNTALQAIGYKEIVAYLQGATTLEEAVETVKRNTRRFVKRQLSWFRRENRIEWFERLADGAFAPHEENRLWSHVEDFLEGK